MRKIILWLVFVVVSLMADDWPFICKLDSLSDFSNKRYIIAADSLADSQSILIDRKNEIIKVWLVEFVSKEKRKKERIRGHKDYGYSKTLVSIDYRNMRFEINSINHFQCDGDIVEYSASNSSWFPIVPDSGFEDIARNIMERYKLK
jgi:hypothetical protein